MMWIHLLLLFTLQAQAQPDCSRLAGSLPNAEMAAGKSDPKSPIQHIVVIMQENHSFDNYFGSLSEPEFYGSEVDGRRPGDSNPDAESKPVFPFPAPSLCSLNPDHSWNAMHADWDGGKQDGFVLSNQATQGGTFAMEYYQPGDLPFYYGLANQFAIGDRYFCSLLGPTFPNRFYLLTATSFGHIRNDIPHFFNQFSQKTIFDVLNKYKISWKYYADDGGYLRLFLPLYFLNGSKIRPVKEYTKDLSAGTLPQVAFVDATAMHEDEHPSSSVQIGQAWVAQRVRELIGSSAWKSSVLFLTYDENGGFYDHVSPPEACVPDRIAPKLKNGDTSARFDRYGFRVPFVVVSPYVKHHFVSHATYDHTSILKYIETRFNLPALTARDANADPFTDLFDYANPVFEVGDLPSGQPDPARQCKLNNLN